MEQENLLGKVSNCCGDRLITNNDLNECTVFFTCFNCKKPCDWAVDCAECFPQHYPEEHFKNKTVPICNKHAKKYYPEVPKKRNNNAESEPEVTINHPSNNNLEELLDEIQKDVNRGYTIRNLKAFLLDLNPEHIDYRVVAQFIAKRIKELERQERMKSKKKVT